MFTEEETKLLVMLLNNQIKLHQNSLRKSLYDDTCNDTYIKEFNKKRIKNYKEILKKLLDK